MKYRLVKQTDNGSMPPTISYVIEKRVRFLFWTWWSRSYLPFINGYYDFLSLTKAENYLQILNKNKKRFEIEEISSRLENTSDCGRGLKKPLPPKAISNKKYTSEKIVCPACGDINYNRFSSCACCKGKGFIVRKIRE